MDKLAGVSNAISGSKGCKVFLSRPVFFYWIVVLGLSYSNPVRFFSFFLNCNSEDLAFKDLIRFDTKEYRT